MPRSGRLAGLVFAAIPVAAGAAGELLIAAGDLPPDGVVLWAQGDAPGCVLMDIERIADGAGQRFVAPLERDADFTARVPVGGLAAGAEHRWWATPVNCDPPVRATGPATTGRFRVPPDAGAAVPLRLAFGADLAGQNACRDAARGFPVFEALARWKPEVFVALGDMVYADDHCRRVGLFGNDQVPGPPPAAHLDAFRAHWRYTRADPALRAFLPTALQVVTWDDHEVLDDFSPDADFRADAPARRLMPAGRRALFEQNPLSAPSEDATLYRSLRWGSGLELFVLDTRSHRDPAERADDGPEPKTLLGEAQRAWLTASLSASDARWKVIASSVPLAIPTGWPASRPRDGWADGGGATGYERELAGILRAAAEAGVTGLVVISADVHFATALVHRPFPSAHPGFRVDEIVVGPMNAGLFPNPGLDATLNPERLYWHAPPPTDTPADFDAALAWMNFGVLDLGADGELVVNIVDARGELVFRRRLD